MIANSELNNSTKYMPVEFDPAKRPPVGVSLIAHVEGARLPQPCNYDIETMAGAIVKRAASRLPPPDKGLLSEFSGYVRKKLQKYDPLDIASKDEFVAWLEEVNQPLWRKEEYAYSHEKVQWLELEIEPVRVIKLHWCHIDGFGKEEPYMEYKHERGINARRDEYKVLVGPIFKLIEKLIFKHKAFIKKIPVKDRPQYIMDYLYREGGFYFSTDFKSFEASFVEEVMRACEFELYQWAVQGLAKAKWFTSLVQRFQLGENVMFYRHLIAKLVATRMSGEMCTSLGNGFTNLMLLKFVAYKLGVKIKPVVEGDDGLSWSSHMFTEEMFIKLGFNIKLEWHTSLTHASFCGLIFDPEEKINLADPVKVLLSTGWTGPRYARASPNKLKTLLRAKALSILYQYPGAPVLTSFARYLMRMTASYDIRPLIKNIRDTYQRDMFIAMYKWYRETPLEMIYKESGPLTRQLMASKFGMPEGVQIDMERYFDSLTELGPIRHWWINYSATPDQVDSFVRFVYRFNPKSRDVIYPPINWERLEEVERLFPGKPDEDWIPSWVQLYDSKLKDRLSKYEYTELKRKERDYISSLNSPTVWAP